MSVVSLEVADRISAGVRHVAERLEGAGRVEASQAMGEEVQVLVVAHLRGLQSDGAHHKTRARLGGGEASNFIAQAASAADVAGVVQADADGVSLHLRHPIVARAFRDIQIEAKGSGALTIPVAAVAYNRRAEQFSGLYVFKSKTTGNSFLAQRAEKGEKPILLYLLVRSVTQRQDRSLMPSADEIHDAAARGLTGFVHRTMREARRG